VFSPFDAPSVGAAQQSEQRICHECDQRSLQPARGREQSAITNQQNSTLDDLDPQ